MSWFNRRNATPTTERELVNAHLVTSFDCIISIENVETMPPTPEVKVDLGNIAMRKHQALTDLAPATSDIEVTLAEPLDVLADALTYYLGRALVVNVTVKLDQLVVCLTCAKDADPATVIRHTRDYLRNRVGLNVQEDNGITYRGRGAGVER